MVMKALTHTTRVMSKTEGVLGMLREGLLDDELGRLLLSAGQ